MLVVSVGYAFTIAGIASSGGTPSTPWLTIPESEYFKWEVLFVIPVTLGCWILAAGVVHVLSTLCGGRGTFEDTLALLGFAIAIPTLLSLIPDAVRAVLTSFGFLSRSAWEQAVSRAWHARFRAPVDRNDGVRGGIALPFSGSGGCSGTPWPLASDRHRRSWRIRIPGCVPDLHPLKTPPTSQVRCRARFGRLLEPACRPNIYNRPERAIETAR